MAALEVQGIRYEVQGSWMLDIGSWILVFGFGGGSGRVMRD